MLGAQPSKASSPNKVTPANVRAGAVRPPEGQAAPTIYKTQGPYITNLLHINRTQVADNGFNTDDDDDTLTMTVW